MPAQFLLQRPPRKPFFSRLSKIRWQCAGALEFGKRLYRRGHWHQSLFVRTLQYQRQKSIDHRRFKCCIVLTSDSIFDQPILVCAWQRAETVEHGARFYLYQYVATSTTLIGDLIRKLASRKCFLFGTFFHTASLTSDSAEDLMHDRYTSVLPYYWKEADYT